ncbi:MAG: hypothetical protein DDT23_00019 [candidate division WS2 bacterium]|nr:hypothetical protein [Candidatus Lithacetigena glycinireducens]
MSVWSTVSWVFRDDITSAKLQAMSNNDLYLRDRLRFHYVGDETERSVAGTTETEIKFFRMIKHPNAYNLRLLRFFAELRVSAASTGTLRIYLDGAASPSLTLTTIATAFELLNGSIDVSAWADGVHTVSIRLLNSTTATTINRLLECYVEVV